MTRLWNKKGKARSFTGLSCFAVALLALGVSGASAQSTRDLASRLNRLENDMQTLNRAVYKGEAPSYSGDVSSGGSSQAAFEVRLQQLETEMRSLTGKIEEQNYSIRKMQEDLERFMSDVNLRLTDIEQGGAAGAINGANAAQPNRASQYIARNSEGDLEAQNPPTPAPRVNASTPAGYQWSSGGTLNANGSAQETPASIYESAYSLMKNNQYEESAKGFDAFLKAYPEHALAGNAKYWLGETYYVRNDYATAARVFAEGYQKYPKSPKAADNLLKLGMALAGLEKKADACVALEQLKKEHSTTAAPVVRRGEQEMTKLGC